MIAGGEPFGGHLRDRIVILLETLLKLVGVVPPPPLDPREAAM
jgi:hypothetical protein